MGYMTFDQRLIQAGVKIQTLEAMFSPPAWEYLTGTLSVWIENTHV